MGNADEGVTLTFEVLTQRVPGPRPNSVVWIARSATTGHVAHADTEENAIERLFAGITALIQAAIDLDGSTPEKWFAANQFAEPHFVHEFARMERDGAVLDLPDVAGPSGLRMELKKATQTAIA